MYIGTHIYARTHTHTHTYRVGQNMFTVVNMGNRVLFIDNCIISHTNNCKPTFALPYTHTHIHIYTMHIHTHMCTHIYIYKHIYEYMFYILEIKNAATQSLCSWITQLHLIGVSGCCLQHKFPRWRNLPHFPLVELRSHVNTRFAPWFKFLLVCLFHMHPAGLITCI